MLGWMLIFTLLTFTAALGVLGDGVGFTPGMTASVVFGFLLLVSVLTRTLRGQA